MAKNGNKTKRLCLSYTSNTACGNALSTVFKMYILFLVAFCQLTEDLGLVGNELFKAFVGLCFLVFVCFAFFLT